MVAIRGRDYFLGNLAYFTGEGIWWPKIPSEVDHQTFIFYFILFISSIHNDNMNNKNKTYISRNGRRYAIAASYL